jgi:hypothetical protein
LIVSGFEAGKLFIEDEDNEAEILLEGVES